MADADPLAAALAAIRAEGYLDGPVPRLLKVVEAARVLADQHEARGQSVPTWELRAAIERALTGEDKTS